jgi:hypothetical protein
MGARVLVGLLALALLGACVPATTLQAYIEPTLTADEITAGGVVILPLGLGSAVQDANLPELRRQLSRRVGEQLEDVFLGAQVFGIDDTLVLLESGGLLDAYSEASRIFDQTGVLRAETMATIVEAAGVQFAAFPYLQSARVRESGFGFDFRRVSSAVFTIVLWDGGRRRSVFEGSGAAEVSAGIFGGPGIIDAVYQASDRAVQRLSQGLR